MPPFFMNFLQAYAQQQLSWQPNKKSYLELQHGYRAGTRIGYASLAQIQAYVFTRFPATYGVCKKLIEQHLQDQNIRSVLDWGCGIGTASLALGEKFQDLQIQLVEQDTTALKYAKQFIGHFYPQTTIVERLREVDLSIFSYSLCEVADWQKTLDAAWQNTTHLLIIEPGTPEYYKRLMTIREHLLKQGAYLWAPCCHTKNCPLKPDDWCHFSLQVERSKEHRSLKNATRGFENEAYSYLLFSKEPKNLSAGRLIGAPRIHGGHVALKICTENGDLQMPIIGRSHPDYKAAKKARWGDAWSTGIKT